MSASASKLLEGKRALVTGGASGIGRAAARLLVEHGARVALLDVDEAAARDAARELDAVAVVADVADETAVAAAVSRAGEELRGLDVLINNAGTGKLAPATDYSKQDWTRLVEVNLAGAFYVMQAAVPLLRASGNGVIVNNASASGVRPTRGELPYSAAKAGLIALTQGAAQELAPAIRVNAVSPGVIRTPMSEPLFRDEETLAPVRGATPLGRTGTAEEVAAVILFLASDLSSFMTGQNLIVDGGLGLPQAGIDEVLKKLLGVRS